MNGKIWRKRYDIHLMHGQDNLYIVEVHYADPDRRDVDLDHQLSQLQPDEDLDMNEDAVYESTFDIEEEDPQLSEQIVQYFNSQ